MIQKLRVQNFRKHTDFAVEFGERATIITGANGSGKTSLIEAIYIALQGKSWRSNFTEIIRGGDSADWWRVDVEFADGETRAVKFSDSKVFEIANQTFSRLPAKFKKPVILFEPSDLQLLYGSPSRRRDFLDRFISQIEPAHSVNLRKFERVLRQRNNLLKRGTTRDELFVWDLQFADLAEKIIAARSHWIHEISAKLTEQYRAIASAPDEISAEYHCPQKTRQQILNQLSRDLADNWPWTRCGPQTHDIKFKINRHDAKLTASRGENRTIIVSILAIMTRLLHEKFGPVYVLLDDIDSELDDVRRRNLHNQKLFADDFLFITAVKSAARSGVVKL